MSEGISKRYLVEKGESIFIRENKLISIMRKVWANSDIEKDSFETIVSSMKPYGLRGDFFKDPSKYDLPPIKEVASDGDLRILGLDGLKRVYRYIPKDYPLPKRDLLNDYKIFIPRNVGSGEFAVDHDAFDDSYGGIYWPWLSVSDPYTRKNIWLPPEGLVLAQYAYSDSRSVSLQDPESWRFRSIFRSRQRSQTPHKPLSSCSNHPDG